MRRTPSRRAFAPTLAVTRLEDRRTPATVNWTGGATGLGTDWLDGNNWVVSGTSPPEHRVPTIADMAIVGGGSPAIVLNGSAAVGDLQFNRGAGLDITGGSLALGAASHILTNVRLAGGSLDVASGATLQGNLQGPNAFTNATGRTITLLTPFGASDSYVNQGVTVVDTQANLNGPVTAPAGSTFRVLGGTFNSTLFTTGFTNDGTIELTTTTNSAASASVVVQSGTLTNPVGGLIAARLGAGASIRRIQMSTGVAFVNAGAILVETGATLQLVTLSPFTWQGGTVSGGGILDLPTLSIAAGATLTTPADATLLLDADGVNGPGTFVIPAGRTQLFNSILTAPIDIQGVAVVTSTQFNGPVTTAAGSTLRLQNRNGNLGNLTTTGFTNNGLIEFASSNVGLTVPGGTGAFTNAPGGVITFLGSGVNFSASGSAANSFTNQGTINVIASGTIGAFGTTNVGQIAVSAGQTLTFGVSAFTNAVGGLLTGSGTVNSGAPITNAGTVSPGDSPGILTITAPYIQTATGSLAVELNGPAVGTEYDQLKVVGTVTLDGALTIDPASTPSVGTVFTIIDNDGTDAVSGTFAGLPQLGTLTVAGATYRISYTGGTGNDVTLAVLSTGAGAPRVSGLQVNAGQTNLTQRSRVTSLTVTFSTQVTFAGAVEAAFGLSRIGGGAVGGFTATANVVSGMTVVTLTGFTGAETNFGSLADGRYALVVRANQVTAGGQQLDGDGNGTGGDDYALNGSVANGLFRLFGDVNADGVVNAFDFSQFRPTFGSSTGDAAYLDYLDFNADGAINAFDFGQLRTRFGRGVTGLTH